MRLEADRYVTLVEVLELTVPYQEFLEAVGAAARGRRGKGTRRVSLLRRPGVHRGWCDPHLLRPRAPDRTHRDDLEVGEVREVLRLREASGRARLRRAERESGGVDRAVRRPQQEVRASRGRLRPLTVPNGCVRSRRAPSAGS